MPFCFRLIKVSVLEKIEIAAGQNEEMLWQAHFRNSPQYVFESDVTGGNFHMSFQKIHSFPHATPTMQNGGTEAEGMILMHDQHAGIVQAFASDVTALMD